MTKAEQISEIAKMIGEDCEMRGLEENTCFDVPERTCDKCKWALWTAEKIYEIGYRKKGEVDDENQE